MTAVSIRDLVVERGKRTILRGLSADIERGKVTGLLGPSGCGKTTLMRSVVGVQKIESGSIAVLGKPAGAAELRKQVGYLTQAPSVYGDLTVKENLEYFAAVMRIDTKRVAGMLHTVDLDEYASRRVSDLSGGQRARVSLATAMIGDPDVLVLDEPTVGLDPLLRRDLWSTFHALANGGTTLLVSSHVMDEAERCDDLLLMREGAFLAHGTPDDLLRQTAANDMEAAFVALIEEGDPGAS